jgi:hypothetical protein
MPTATTRRRKLAIRDEIAAAKAQQPGVLGVAAEQQTGVSLIHSKLDVLTKIQNLPISKCGDK